MSGLIGIFVFIVITVIVLLFAFDALHPAHHIDNGTADKSNTKLGWAWAVLISLIAGVCSGGFSASVGYVIGNEMHKQRALRASHEERQASRARHVHTSSIDEDN